MKAALPSPPRSIDAWLERLDATSLPISDRQREQLHRELRRGDRPLRIIAQRLQTCPALTLALLREANRHAPGPLGSDSEHLESALVRLGLSRAATILQELPERNATTLPPTLIQLLLIMSFFPDIAFWKAAALLIAFGILTTVTTRTGLQKGMTWLNSLPRPGRFPKRATHKRG